MKIQVVIPCVCVVLALGFCAKNTQQPEILPSVPEGAQAVSLMGEPLYAPAPSDSTLEKLEDAKKAFDTDPRNADNIIWLGRRTGIESS